MTTRRLCYHKPKDKEYILFAFDIEYTRKDGVLLEACIGTEDTQQFFSTWEDTLQSLFNIAKDNGRNTRFIVHAGDIAEFNHLIHYIMNSPHREEIEVLPTISGENIVALTLKWGKRRVDILDMFALFPMGLEEIAKKFAPQYPKLATAVDFSKRDYDPSTDRAYLQRDVQATVASYRSICALIKEHFGILPSMTAAGTAMRGWLSQLPKDANFFA